jgi:hypothetical protein
MPAARPIVSWSGTAPALGGGAGLSRGASLWLAAWLSCAAPAAAQVAIVTQAPQDHEVAVQLGQLIESEVREHATTGERSISALMKEAETWPEPHVVVVDRPGDTIHVLRPRDRTMVSRVLAPEVMRDSQYAVALASAELLEWLGVLPAARGRPSDREPPAPSGKPIDAPVVPTEASGPPQSALGWGLGADLELVTSPGFDVSMARASISGEVQLGRRRGPSWYAFGARVGAPASWDRALNPGAASAGVERITYSDVMASLHAGLGYGAGRATILGEIEGGLSLARVQALDADGARVGDHEDVDGWIGLGVGLRYPLVWGLSVAAAVQGRWLADRATYRVQGTKVLEEGPVRVVSRIGLIWESALFRRSP